MDLVKTADEVWAIVGTAQTSKKPAAVYAGISSLFDWLEQLLALADVCRFKEDVISMADQAIDALVAIDLPLPGMIDYFEPLIDKILASVLKAQVRGLVNKVCP